MNNKGSKLRIPERGILNIYGTLFFDPPFLWSQMVKNYFFTIENPFRGFFWAQQGGIQQPRGQDEVGGWLVKCPRFSTGGR